MGDSSPGSILWSDASGSARKPVRPIRHRDLEPCPFSGITGFGDRDAGNGEDLAGEIEAKTGMFAKTFGE